MTETLWDVASRDVDAEVDARRMAQLRVATQPHFAFLAKATDRQDFSNRFALVGDRVTASVERVVGQDLAPTYLTRIAKELQADWHTVRTAHLAPRLAEGGCDNKECGHSAADHNKGPNADECSECDCSYFRKTASAKTAGYTTGDGQTFPTEGEAKAHANDVHERTGNVISVEKTAAGLDNLGDNRAAPFGSKGEDEAEEDDTDKTAKVAYSAPDGTKDTCGTCGKPIQSMDYAWYHMAKDFPHGEDHNAHPSPHKSSVRHTAPGGGEHAPYRIEQRGDKWAVVNDLGETKSTFDSEEKARQYQKALYANVPGASESAEKKSSAKVAYNDADVSQASSEQRNYNEGQDTGDGGVGPSGANWDPYEAYQQACKDSGSQCVSRSEWEANPDKFKQGVRRVSSLATLPPGTRLTATSVYLKQAGFPTCAEDCGVTLSASDDLINTDSGLAHTSCVLGDAASRLGFSEASGPNSVGESIQQFQERAAQRCEICGGKANPLMHGHLDSSHNDHEFRPKTAAADGGWHDAATKTLTLGPQKVDGMLLDAYTASMLTQVHDALSPENQAKFRAMPLRKACDIGWQLAKKSAAASNYCYMCSENLGGKFTKPKDVEGKGSRGEPIKARLCGSRQCDERFGRLFQKTSAHNPAPGEIRGKCVRCNGGVHVRSGHDASGSYEVWVHDKAADDMDHTVHPVGEHHVGAKTAYNDAPSDHPEGHNRESDPDTETCSACNGTGEDDGRPCQSCNGKGYITKAGSKTALKLQCQECKHRFSRTNPRGEVRCPKCKGYDVDVDYSAAKTADYLDDRSDWISAPLHEHHDHGGGMGGGLPGLGGGSGEAGAAGELEELAPLALAAAIIARNTPHIASDTAKCEDCNGTGQVPSITGEYETCPTCHGKGTVVNDSGGWHKDNEHLDNRFSRLAEAKTCGQYYVGMSGNGYNCTLTTGHDGYHHSSRDPYTHHTAVFGDDPWNQPNTHPEPINDWAEQNGVAAGITDATQGKPFNDGGGANGKGAAYARGYKKGWDSAGGTFKNDSAAGEDQLREQTQLEDRKDAFASHTSARAGWVATEEEAQRRVEQGHTNKSGIVYDLRYEPADNGGFHLHTTRPRERGQSYAPLPPRHESVRVSCRKCVAGKDPSGGACDYCDGNGSLDQTLAMVKEADGWSQGITAEAFVREKTASPTYQMSHLPQMDGRNVTLTYTSDRGVDTVSGELHIVGNIAHIGGKEIPSYNVLEVKANGYGDARDPNEGQGRDPSPIDYLTHGNFPSGTFGSTGNRTAYAWPPFHTTANMFEEGNNPFAVNGPGNPSKVTSPAGDNDMAAGGPGNPTTTHPRAKPSSQPNAAPQMDPAMMQMGQPMQQMPTAPAAPPVGGETSPRSAAKVMQIAEGILASNPGMNDNVAVAIAKETVRRFPKVVADQRDYDNGDTIPCPNGHKAHYNFGEKAWYCPTCGWTGPSKR